MALHKGRQGKSKGTEQYLNMNMRRLRQPSHILLELTTEGTLKDSQEKPHFKCDRILITVQTS